MEVESVIIIVMSGCDISKEKKEKKEADPRRVPKLRFDYKRIVLERRYRESVMGFCYVTLQ